jgi:hypothetical protein
MQNCTIRSNLISGRSKNRQSSSDIPTQRFGPWIIDEHLVPPEVIQNARMGNAGTNQRGNTILRRLQRMFAEDPKGKVNVSVQEDQMIRTSFTGQGLFGPNIGGINIGHPSSSSQSHLHMSTQHQFGRQGRELVPSVVHPPHLISPHPSTHQGRQGFTPTITGTDEVPVRVEETSVQRQQTDVLQQNGTRGPPITTKGTNSEKAMMEAINLPHSSGKKDTGKQPGLFLGHENNTLSMPHSKNLALPGKQVEHLNVSSSIPNTPCQQQYLPSSLDETIPTLHKTPPK